MKRLLIVFLLISGYSFGQDVIQDTAEEYPSFPGGDQKMRLWIEKEVKYPSKSSKRGEEGTVYVQFVVWKDGSLGEVKVIRGVSKLLDAEAVRLVKKMPKWEPAKQAGKAVNCRFTLPIRFVRPRRE